MPMALGLYQGARRVSDPYIVTPLDKGSGLLRAIALRGPGDSLQHRAAILA